MSVTDYLKQKMSLFHDYRQTFGSPHGKRVLYDILNAGHVLNTTHVAGDPYTSAIKEGERRMACRILKSLNVKPEELEKILKGEN